MNLRQELLKRLTEIMYSVDENGTIIAKCFTVEPSDVMKLEKEGTLFGVEIPEQVPDEKLFKLLMQFYTEWCWAESNRGCYSCAPAHDARCEKDRKISTQCTCGRDELEKLDGEIANEFSALNDETIRSALGEKE